MVTNNSWPTIPSNPVTQQDVNLAMQAGLMADHLRLLNATAAAQERHRRRWDAVEDAAAAKSTGHEVPQSDDSEMNVYLNSPTVHQYPQQQTASPESTAVVTAPTAVPSAPSPAAGVMGKALLYAGLLAAGGGAVGIPWLIGALTKAAPAAAAQGVDRTIQFFEPVVEPAK